MKRNFSAVVTDLDGQAVKAGPTVDGILRAVNTVWADIPADVQTKLAEAIEKEAGKDLTLASVCTSALMAAYEDDKSLSDDERVARMELARRIHKGGVVDIEPKDRDRIKPLIKKRFGGILIPVVSCELLEQDAD